MSSNRGSSKGKGRADSAEALYISAGCNRYSGVADCRESDGLVAYGAGKLVALWRSEDSDQRGVFQTLADHTGQITCLQFLRNEHTPCKHVISGDSSGKIVIWKEHSDTQEWQNVAQLQLDATIGALASHTHREGGHLLGIGSSNGKLSLAIYDNEGLKVVQNITLRADTIPMAIAFSSSPGCSATILAVGGTNNKIAIYVKSPDNADFHHTADLPGHADWIRSLAFSTPLVQGCLHHDQQDDDILLASASQDNFIRLWRISRIVRSDTEGSSASTSVLDILDQLSDGEGEAEVTAKHYDLCTFERSTPVYSCMPESVLLGHDNWVTDVNWQTQPAGRTAPKLLSTSADRSMIMWECDPNSGLWLSLQRFGEIGGTNLGFFGALWGCKDDAVLAHGWSGSFHVWRRVSTTWSASVSISGHYDDVTSLAWEPGGDYLITVSTDQTARIHAPWHREGVETWHEMSRAQIHGYDMYDVACISRLRYISGSEEKTVRVFDTPDTFIESMHALGATNSLQSAENGQRPKAATVPALGLSNKAVFSGEPTVSWNAVIFDICLNAQVTSELNGTDLGTSEPVRFATLQRPPLEEQLLTSTLWPEVEKLYGHGYEINAVAAAHDGTLIASSCRSTTAEHAVIRLHRSSDWVQLQSPLSGHSLTISRIVFSPDDRYILSVGRDRSWHVHQRAEKKGDLYFAFAQCSKAHARIIWDAAWAADGTFFVTASRDKTVKLWAANHSGESTKPAASLDFSDAATSVSLCTYGSLHVLAVGLESGIIAIYTASLSKVSVWTERLTLSAGKSHRATVSRLAWRPQQTVRRPLVLASSSADRSVRVTTISIDASVNGDA